MVFKKANQDAQKIVNEEESRVEAQADKTAKQSKTWQIQEVATQTAPVIVNTNTGENYNLYDAVAEILNILQEVQES